MQPTSNINNPNGMDELLKKAFLDLDMSNAEDSKLMDQMAQQVMQTELFVNGTSSNMQLHKKIKVKSWIWYLSASAILLSVTVAALIVFDKSNEKLPIVKKEEGIRIESSEGYNQNQIQTSQTHLLDTNTIKKSGEENKNIDIVSNTIKEKKAVKFSEASVTEIKPIIETPINTINDATIQKTDSSVAEIKETKPTTLLSQEELLQHKKQMKALKDIYAGQRIEDYALIKAEAKNTVIGDGLYMKEGEVSMKEYKLFLTDLLANGKASEYEKAKPKFDKIWTDKKDSKNKRLLETYFKSDKYEHYPVLCVPTEGMEMYCKWLQEQLQSFYNSKNEKITFTVRLPEIQEWKYAASSGNKSYMYGTRNGKLKSTAWSHLIFFGRYWNANFIETQPKFVAKNDTLDDSINEKKKHQEVRSTLSKESFTHIIRSNLNEKMQLYNMSGNVSEIVTYLDDSGNKMYRTIGGNWNSTKEFLKVEATDEFNQNTNPSPYIGFRPIIIIGK